ncbi:hypothetical protein [Phenylobacterium montanum]|uniref:Uncharacterized protein n=1 Tax=Phenylobacterium montanum TaxID=2823693 RepID=A0A975G2H4_9CAUL|nr:hypothetical protein [Caulobacter sp. S6]QUD89379.1 hypothetical protein KCG34_05725 [Caulobacter sp. S6]
MLEAAEFEIGCPIAAMAAEAPRTLKPRRNGRSRIFGWSEIITDQLKP